MFDICEIFWVGIIEKVTHFGDLRNCEIRVNFRNVEKCLKTRYCDTFFYFIFINHWTNIFYFRYFASLWLPFRLVFTNLNTFSHNSISQFYRPGFELGTFGRWAHELISNFHLQIRQILRVPTNFRPTGRFRMKSPILPMIHLSLQMPSQTSNPSSSIIYSLVPEKILSIQPSDPPLPNYNDVNKSSQVRQ